jgi:beta-galactosidase
MRRALLADREMPYACDGAIVYRLAAPAADHYFFINDGEPREVRLDTRRFRYRRVTDPVSGAEVQLGGPVALEAHSGRWLRFEK